MVAETLHCIETTILGGGTKDVVTSTQYATHHPAFSLFNKLFIFARWFVQCFPPPCLEPFHRCDQHDLGNILSVKDTTIVRLLLQTTKLFEELKAWCFFAFIHSNLLGKDVHLSEASMYYHSLIHSIQWQKDVSTPLIHLMQRQLDVCPIFFRRYVVLPQ